jgi:hypothetical protein
MEVLENSVENGSIVEFKEDHFDQLNEVESSHPRDSARFDKENQATPLSVA